VFVINPAGNTYQVLHQFIGSADGADPVDGLVFDSRGNLWGTARTGGADNFGTVFELAAPGYTTLAYVHSFKGTPNGANPAAALTFDPSVGGALGTLYGTTSAGGNQACSGGCGLVFELEISGLVFKNIYKLSGAGSTKSGSAPVGRLAIDTSNDGHTGHLYGTASLGGTDTGNCGATGCGTAFEVCPPTRSCGFREYTLLRFNGTDGQTPGAGLLLNLTFPGEPEGHRKFPPPAGTRGACTTNCVGTAQSGGSNGAGVVIGFTH